MESICILSSVNPRNRNFTNQAVVNQIYSSHSFLTEQTFLSILFTMASSNPLIFRA